MQRTFPYQSLLWLPWSYSALHSLLARSTQQASNGHLKSTTVLLELHLASASASIRY